MWLNIFLLFYNYPLKIDTHPVEMLLAFKEDLQSEEVWMAVKDAKPVDSWLDEQRGH